jgi:hypothetical protein
MEIPKCPVCEDKFYTDDDRTVIDHVMWKHREKPRYHCSICGDTTNFGMISSFDEHCKKEHSCDKNDHIQKLFLKVDSLPLDIAKEFFLEDAEYQELQKGREELSDVEDDGEEKENILKTEPALEVANMEVGFKRKEMFLICNVKTCDWRLSSRELFIADKLKDHVKTHE